MRPIVLIIFLLVFLRPHIDAIGPVFAVYFGDLLLAVFVSIFLIGKGDSLRISETSAAFIATSLIGMLFPLILIFFRPEFGTLTEAGKFFYYLIFTLALLSISGVSPENRRDLNRALDLMVIPISLVAAIQLLEIPGLVDLIWNLWGTAKLRGLSSGSPRVFSTFYNSNWYGVVMAMLCLTYLRRVTNLKVRLARNAGLFILSFCLLVTSGSRSAFLAFAIGASILWLMNLAWSLAGSRSRGNRGTLLIVLLGAFLFFALVTLGASYKRVAEIMLFIGSGDISDIRSATERIQSWIWALDTLTGHEIMGIGEIGKQLAPHNSFLFMMLLFGAIGSMGILVALLSFILALGNSSIGRSITLCAPLLALLAAASLTGEFLFSTQVMLIFLLVAACWFEGACNGITIFHNYRSVGKDSKVIAVRGRLSNT
jgi:hypothetical protein